MSITFDVCMMYVTSIYVQLSILDICANRTIFNITLLVYVSFKQTFVT